MEEGAIDEFESSINLCFGDHPFIFSGEADLWSFAHCGEASVERSPRWRLALSHQLGGRQDRATATTEPCKRAGCRLFGDPRRDLAPCFAVSFSLGGSCLLPGDGPPEGLCALMTKFKEAGFAVYIVGGAIRDAMLYGSWRAVIDWDLATSALPHQVEALFPHTIPQGREHGTVRVLSGDIEAEVTTFRIEGGYSDHRRPDTVSFTGQIQKDLQRRDFTIGAMAYDPLVQEFVDPYGGREDLEGRLLRAVGDPRLRLAEDHLRMLRAVRFASTLAFQLEESLAQAICEASHNIGTIAPERIAMELVKILRGPDPARGLLLLQELGLLREVMPQLGPDLELSLGIIAQTPPVLDLRIAAMLWGSSEEVARDILSRLRFPRSLVERVLLLLGWQQINPQGWTEHQMRQFLSQVGKGRALDLVALWRGEARSRGEDTLKLEAQLEHLVILAGQDLPLRLEDIAMDGRGVMELLAMESGPGVGKILNSLLAKVIENPALNNEAALQQLVLKWKE